MADDPRAGLQEERLHPEDPTNLRLKDWVTPKGPGEYSHRADRDGGWVFMSPDGHYGFIPEGDAEVDADGRVTVARELVIARESADPEDPKAKVVTTVWRGRLERGVFTSTPKPWD
jgi:hypothetical protein